MDKGKYKIIKIIIGLVIIMILDAGTGLLFIIFPILLLGIIAKYMMKKTVSKQENDKPVIKAMEDYPLIKKEKPKIKSFRLFHEPEWDDEEDSGLY